MRRSIHRWHLLLPSSRFSAKQSRSPRPRPRPWLPWSWYWNFWKGNQEFNAGRYREAIPYYHRSLKLNGDPQPNWNNISAAWHNIGVYALRHNDYAAQEEADRESEAAKQKAGPDTGTPTQDENPSGEHSGIPTLPPKNGPKDNSGSTK